MTFDMKSWLDDNVVPAINEKPLAIYSFIWNGNPPKEILVWLSTLSERCKRCGTLRGEPSGEECAAQDCDWQPEATDWAQAVKELLEDGWRFDYTREQQLVAIGNQTVKAFGGDGAPLFSPDGMASVRLFRKMEDGTGLILQVACKFWPLEPRDGLPGMTPGEHAAWAVKGFFAQFQDGNPLEVCAKYGAQFGAA